MADKILINHHNPIFIGLMSQLVRGIRTNNKSDINHVKVQFEKADINVAYNSESDKIEILEKGCRPVVFDAKEFESNEAPEKEKEKVK